MNRTITAARAYIALSLLLLGGASAVQGQKARAVAAMPAIAWVFDIKRDADTTPRANVSLQVGKKRIHLMKTTAEFQKLTMAEYKDRNIPSDALAACSGWWAGQGVDLYVIRRGKRLEVFLRGLDEQAETPPYKRIKVIAL